MRSFDFRGWWSARPEGHPAPVAPPRSWLWPSVAVLASSVAVVVTIASIRQALLLLPCSLGALVLGQGVLGLPLSWRGHLLNFANTAFIGAVGAVTAQQVGALGPTALFWMSMVCAFAVMSMPVLGYLWAVTLFAQNRNHARHPWPWVPEAIEQRGANRVVCIERFDDDEALVTILGEEERAARVGRRLVEGCEPGDYVLLIRPSPEVVTAGYREQPEATADAPLTAAGVHRLGKSLDPEPDRAARNAGLVVLLGWHLFFFGAVLTLVLLT